MNQLNWSNNDYQNGLIFISNYEDKIASKTIIATDKGVILILPSGLPIYGIGFYGIFMLAPIVLFMITITYFVFIILTANSLEIQIQILLSTAGSILFWALTKAFKLVISSRELFPIKYFATLGPHGIAAHYSYSYFPGHSRVAIKWDQIDSVRTFSSFFLPGLFAGILKTFFVEVISKNATVLKIPFHSTDEQALRISQDIVDLIHQKMNH